MTAANDPTVLAELAAENIVVPALPLVADVAALVSAEKAVAVANKIAPIAAESAIQDDLAADAAGPAINIVLAAAPPTFLAHEPTPLSLLSRNG